MHKKLLLATALLLPFVAVHAQSTPGKKVQVARILKVQQPGIESMARSLAENPARAIMDRAGAVMATRIAPDKREAMGKDIQADVKKYIDEAVPLVRDRALKIAPDTVGAVLEEQFSEDDLRQLAGFLESPVYIKFAQLGGDMQKRLIDKLLVDTRGAIDPKITALELSVGKRLGLPPPAAAAPAPAASK